MKFKFSLSRLVEEAAVVEYEAESLEEAKELVTGVDWGDIASEKGAEWDAYGEQEGPIVTHINGKSV